MSTRSFSFIDGNPLSTEAILVNASSSHYGEDWSSIRHTHPFTELFMSVMEMESFSLKTRSFLLQRTI